MTTDPILFDIGKRVRALREINNITQKALAQQVGLTRMSIANIEAGKQNPTVVTLAQMAAALSVTVGALLGETPMPELPRVFVANVWIMRCVECKLNEEFETSQAAHTRRSEHIQEHTTGKLAGDA